MNPEIEATNIHELFAFYDQAFFNGALDGKVLLEWSDKMTQCAGLCYLTDYRKSSGLGLFCTVRLSKPLLKYRSVNELLETLLHELIHAFLFVTKDRRSRDIGDDGHGPDFIEKMLEINEVTGLRLSVYHTFSNEVDQARKHVWLCNGKKCNRPPFFGVVKRARNMPPGPQDYWFAKHNAECGGRFIKVVEPEPK